MRYLTFGAERSSYKIAILVNEIRRDDILKAYVYPYGLNENDIIVIDLYRHPTKKKTPAADQKAYIKEELAPTLLDLDVKYLLIADGDYFKTFTKTTRIDTVIGYAMTTEFGPWQSIYVPNYRAIFHDPVNVKQRIEFGVNALNNLMAGTYAPPGADIIKFSAYPQTVEEISDWLDRLLEMDCPLTIDIEGFSLKHYDAGIGTISFAWSKAEGIAFPVDYEPIPGATEAPFGRQILNGPVRELLKEFFLKLMQKAIYHNIAYDVYVLIYQLFMDNLLDNEGLLRGLEILLRNWDCTKLISYLATNSCAGNKLGLKNQAHEHTGDYAQEDIEDITRIPLPQLLQYNLIDAMATWFVHEKNQPKMVADDQVEVYETLFKPATVDIIQMQLSGMPMDYDQVLRVNEALVGISNDALDRIRSSGLIKSFENVLLIDFTKQKNEEWVKKRATPNEILQMAQNSELVRKAITFNPNSDPQMRKLLYEMLGLPVIDRTDTKLPATGGKTLKKLINHTSDPDVKDLLDGLIDFVAVGTILSNFMPTFLNAVEYDGWHWIFGFFNLGGTVSGRLSSSKPNLQNIPANVDMTLSKALFEKFKDVIGPYVKDGKLSIGKLIKSCFKAPPGWFFCGIDFASLEDRISALTTKDPNKLKVYTDGYDGHALRAFAYFGDEMPDIVETVESINTVADKDHENSKKYGGFRQEGKTPTFLLTYGGTYMGIMQQLGWSQEKAQMIEARYKDLYKVSIDWVADKLQQASKDGYITAAFGLRVRTPLLHQTVRGTSKTPFQAEAEGRTAGNALGQSWCLLNSRAGSEFMGEVRSSEFKHSIKPCAQIHDAQYYLVKDDIDAVVYANTKVVEACQWQDHPEIWHDEVKLGGEFGIFYPDWSQEMTLPNGATPEAIYTKFEEHVLKITKKAA
jgi:DNA polymerase-1